MKYIMVLAMLCFSYPAMASEQVVQSLLDQYRGAGADAFDASRGESMWQQQYLQPEEEKKVSCASCHSADLRSSGMHMRTGKIIEAMAPSVNAERLTDPEKIEKWFKRNCKWTMGRECTVQEKGDFLVFIQSK
ncbi:MAG: hypothetical protein CO186_12180 [Zetaproteobacteria bacterium CG_4_9_14_3_um_filter_49_83]|nr:MAG: hypothetical protein AUJ56_05495 [Zetaproteobacteria bacterium CG1_02_49_23]PIQ31917.1 MAG: hypothetical protein COW62_08520 [Zetaproteobacteria bacterium CG17_big_fil_post_rev_8_21_14_2_50_50_13]PIV29708.1 MAG: hypothetical protein COS35_10510 [Zetaproteobacteria bacterium CG02_land_8_20_14_3_00_50_9]PIY56188.1 MAG: hypothetical protein COZ00_05575 [Zetaproteobacteria bacterium CG_4_10_14_0_8_um_filter_49_80]PJA33981.1 MAG: hypothetical protein CO186_12180 [Zetaproteobacteria bacterium